jgi:hypothetical protein
MRRTAVIGTVEQLPTRDLAEVAVNGLRVCMNQHRNRQREQSIVVADLVDHYIQTELSDEADWHSHATRIVYSEFLKRWIRPHWETIAITPVDGADRTSRDTKPAYRRNGKAVYLRYCRRLRDFLDPSQRIYGILRSRCESVGLQSEKAFSYNKRTMDWAMGPF